ncbi:MAG TPA: TIGR03790 family protein, partial [Armatimonadota bacterium]
MQSPPAIIRLLLTLAMLLMASFAFAGNGPQNVLIVVNANSQDSLLVGNTYRRARNIPYQHLLTLTTSTAPQISYQSYHDEIQAPIETYLKNQQLREEITCIVLTRGIPLVVKSDTSRSTASLLAAMGLPKSDNHLALLPNPYLNAPDAFSHRNEALKGMYLVTVLNGYQTDDITQLIAQGASADGTMPSGRFVFDTPPQFIPQANEMAKLLTIRNLKAEVTSTPPQDHNGLMAFFSAGIFSGLNKELVSSYTFRPGAIADMAQNFGAAPNNFDESAPAIMLPVSAFIHAGVAGVHGVVGDANMTSMPLANSPQLLLDKYTSGYSLAESFYATLPFLNWQNVILGDPLCAPYVQRPTVSADLEPGTLKGLVPLRISATSPARGTTISRIDVYVDDRFKQTVYEPNKTQVLLYIGEEIVTYAIPHGATLRTLLEGLADAVNNDPILNSPDGVRAIPNLRTGTLQLIARRPGVDSNEVPIGIDIATEAETSPGLTARVEGGWLSGGGQDPVPANATISFLGRRIKPGDAVSVQIQQEHLSYTVPADSASSATLPRALAELINQVPTLQGPDGVIAIPGEQGMPYLTLQARTPGERGNAITIQVTVAPVEGSQLRVYPNLPTPLSGGHDGTSATQYIHFMLGDVNARARYLLNTAELADGYHRVRLVAYDGSLAQAQGAKTLAFLTKNTNALAVSLPKELPSACGSAIIPVTAPARVKQVNVYVDGQLLGSASEAPFAVRIPLTNLGRGAHDLWVESLDEDDHRYVTPPSVLTVRTPPEATLIRPNFASLDGGKTHRITGMGFSAGCTVRLAGIPARTVKYLNPNLLEVTSDAGAARQGWVEVTNPDGTVSEPSTSFEYYRPRVAQVHITPGREVLAVNQKAQCIASMLDQYDFP